MGSATVEKLYSGETGSRDELAVARIEPQRNPLAIAQDIASRLLKQTINLIASDGERERTQRDAILAFAVRVLSAGLLYLTQIVLARWMGGSEYGIYVAVWTWVLILGAMSHLGLNLASIRLAPSYRETGDFEHLRGLIRGVRILAPRAAPSSCFSASWAPGSSKIASKRISCCRSISRSSASPFTR